MTDMNAGDGDTTGYAPNFELSHHGVVREDNWQEYAAKGFVAVPEPFELAQIFYGVGNVYSGDMYSFPDGRPLRHMPGEGVYTSQDGLAYLETQLREEDWFREIHEYVERHWGDPAAS